MPFKKDYERVCTRCGYKWQKRKRDEPKNCPGCKSKNWNKIPKKLKPGLTSLEKSNILTAVNKIKRRESELQQLEQYRQDLRDEQSERMKEWHAERRRKKAIDKVGQELFDRTIQAGNDILTAVTNHPFYHDQSGNPKTRWYKTEVDIPTPEKNGRFCLYVSISYGKSRTGYPPRRKYRKQAKKTHFYHEGATIGIDLETFEVFRAKNRLYCGPGEYYFLEYLVKLALNTIIGL